MAWEALNLKIVLMLTVGFALASILGYLSHRIKLSPILGYLLSGYLIGPYSPGYHADREISEQLAEIGVILMMFGVGLHFRWKDLSNVKKIAIPGAVGQTIITTLIVAAVVVFSGWSIEAGVIYGLAIGVASTVVLVRVLSDNKQLNTRQGHIAVGWLIVEDIITVIALLLVPTLAASVKGTEISFQNLMLSFLTIFIKFVVLAAFIFTFGRKFIRFIFAKIMKTRSHELFILTILAVTFLIATGSAYLFGISISLGAFIAGMIIGQTDVKHKVSSSTLSLKDVFVVIFFLTIGMLFDPLAIFNDFLLFVIILAIILLIKPLAALLLVWLLKYPFSTGLTIAIALAQIGEFSFILVEEASRYRVLPDAAYDIVVACSLISISVNSLLFKIFVKKPTIVE